MRRVLDEGTIFRVYPTGYLNNFRHKEVPEEKKVTETNDARVDFTTLFNEQLGRIAEGGTK